MHIHAGHHDACHGIQKQPSKNKSVTSLLPTQALATHELLELKCWPLRLALCSGLLWACKSLSSTCRQLQVMVEVLLVHVVAVEAVGHPLRQRHARDRDV